MTPRRPASRPSRSRRSWRSTRPTTTDYFKPPHFEKYPQLHDLFNRATKAAGAAGAKGTVNVADADNLLAMIKEIDTIFWETKKAA